MARHALTGVSHVVPWDAPFVHADGEAFGQWIRTMERIFPGVVIDLGDQNRADGCELIVIGRADVVEEYVANVTDGTATPLPDDSPYVTAVGERTSANAPLAARVVE